MSWNRGLLPVQNIRLKKIVFESVQSQQQLCLPFLYVRRWTLDMQQNGWNTAGSLKDHWGSKIVCIPSQISSISRQKKMGIFKYHIQKLRIRTFELRFVCNNHAIQSSLLFHLTIFLSTGDFFLKIELLLLPQ